MLNPPSSSTSTQMADVIHSSIEKGESAEEIELFVTDGGLHGWMTVAGSWLVLFTTFGNLYSYGAYQDYFTRIFMNTHSVSTISWIGSFQLMMPYISSVVAGALFDAGYFRHIMISGSAIFTFSIFMLSLVKPQQYYQAFLSQGVGMGLGVGMTFVPATSIAVRHFPSRRPLASGIALSGAAAGASVFPIMINHLIPISGYGIAVRATGYVSLVCLLLGNCLMKMPPKNNLSSRQSKPRLSDILHYLKDIPYVCALLGVFFILLGSNFPSVYIQLYAVEHQVDDKLAFYSLAIANGAAVVGRVVSNVMAVSYGPLNMIVPTTLFTAGTIWAVLGVHNAASLMVVSILYGTFSGACLSLVIGALASLATSLDEVGARTGLALTLGSLGALMSAPMQGALLSSGYIWIRPIMFSGIITGLSAASFLLARMLVAKTKGSWRV